MDFKVIIIACITLLVIGAILGLVLAVADKYLSVKEDERVTTVYKGRGSGFGSSLFKKVT